MYLGCLLIVVLSFHAFNFFSFCVFDFIANLLFPYHFEFLFFTQIWHYSLLNELQLAAVLKEGEVTDQLKHYIGKLKLDWGNVPSYALASPTATWQVNNEPTKS